MFRQLARNSITTPATSDDQNKAADKLLSLHPAQLAFQLEAVWNNRLGGATPPATNKADLGRPENRSSLQGLPPALLPTGAEFEPQLPETDPPTTQFRWDHLIYAYMIENTRIYAIFRRVLHELLHGEKLGTPSPESVAWLRATEELFYADSAPFLITNITSHIRPSLPATWRTAYQRLFGMDLNHGADDGKPQAYFKAEAANTDFVPTFEEFLREVWVGMTFVTASSSSNPTDDSKIAELAEKLFDMLITRRQNGNLAREEFSAVATMSWFHLTLEYDSPIVKSLRSEASGTEQRLFKIAERVGLPAHGLSKNFFDIADPISRILTQIEMGRYNAAQAVPALYTKVTDGPESDMRTIITHWAAITGRDIKARKVAAN